MDFVRSVHRTVGVPAAACRFLPVAVHQHTASFIIGIGVGHGGGIVAQCFSVHDLQTVEQDGHAGMFAGVVVNVGCSGSVGRRRQGAHIVLVGNTRNDVVDVVCRFGVHTLAREDGLVLHFPRLHERIVVEVLQLAGPEDVLRGLSLEGKAASGGGAVHRNRGGKGKVLVGIGGSIEIGVRIGTVGQVIAQAAEDAYTLGHEECVATRIGILARHRTVRVVGATAHEDFKLRVLHVRAIHLGITQRFARCLHVEQGIVQLLHRESEGAAFHERLAVGIGRSRHGLEDILVNILGLHHEEAGDEIVGRRCHDERTVVGTGTDFHKVLLAGRVNKRAPVHVVGSTRVAGHVLCFERGEVEAHVRFCRLGNADVGIVLLRHTGTRQHRVMLEVIIVVAVFVGSAHEAHTLLVGGAHADVVHARHADVLHRAVREGIEDRGV